MAREYARIHVDIWGDDDWLDLSVEAQMLYYTLYTSPSLSLCGSGTWNPKRLQQVARGWTIDRIEAAADELSRGLFLVIDTDTDEFLLRSWVKHDGLWRTPNMAVSVATARADLASRTLRAVVVFELLKLKRNTPESKSWEKDTVAKMLSQRAVDPAGLPPFDPGPKGGSNPGPKGGSNPGPKGGSNPYSHHGPKGGSNGGPTTATTTTTATERTNVLSNDDDLRFVTRGEPAAAPPGSSSSWSDGTPIPAEPPTEIETAARPPRQHPTPAAKTVVRQEIGSAGYPRRTLDRLAIQAGKLAGQGISDELIREALRTWDRTPDAKPEWLQSICGDVVHNRRSRTAPASVTKPSKLRGIAELAATARAQETSPDQRRIAQ